MENVICDILLFYHGQESNNYGRNKSVRKKKKPRKHFKKCIIFMKNYNRFKDPFLGDWKNFYYRTGNVKEKKGISTIVVSKTFARWMLPLLKWEINYTLIVFKGKKAIKLFKKGKPATSNIIMLYEMKRCCFNNLRGDVWSCSNRVFIAFKK